MIDLTHPKGRTLWLLPLHDDPACHAPQGFALGNRDAISSLESVKAPIDFNQWVGIQRMGVTCLGLPREHLRRSADTWRRRAEAMTRALRERAGWEVRLPSSCM